MKINKIFSIAIILYSQLLAQENQVVTTNSPIANAFQNVQSQIPNEVNPISNEVVGVSPTQPTPMANVEEGFKSTLMNKVDEKMAKIDELERKMNEQQLQNQLNQSNMNFSGGNPSGVSNLSVPVVLGTTIIEKGKKTLSKEILAVDSTGNKFTLNEKNNNIIKTINSDYIVFKDSKDKFPILISNASSVGADGTALGNGASGTMGFPNSMFEVPDSIKAKAENSPPVGSLQDSNVSNTLR